MNLYSLARTLFLFGLLLMVAGGVVYLFARVGIPLGKLPGDIRIERGNFTCILALGTSILLSILLTVLVNLLARFLNK